jgi:hypothetical protein
MGQPPVTTHAFGSADGLVEKVVSDFCLQFSPGGHVGYVSRTGKMSAPSTYNVFAELDVSFDSADLLPDVAVHDAGKGRLLLIDVVTAHGPITPRHRDELEALFAPYPLNLIFITVFPDRESPGRYLDGLSWGTKVWLADEPDHLIHLDGAKLS